MTTTLNTPHAQERSGTLISGGIDSAGNVTIYNGGSLVVVGTTAEDDDHASPAFLSPSDKPTIVAWARHNHDALVHYRIGTVNGDWSTLGTDKTLNVGTLSSYAQLFREPSTNNLLLITRDNNRYWKFFKSTDYGTTWSAAATLLDYGASTQAYLRTAQRGSTVRCVAHLQIADAGDHKVYYFEINLTTGSITKVDGTVLGNLSGTSLPLTPAVLGVAYTPAAGDTTNAEAVGTGPTVEFAISRYVLADGSSPTWEYVYWDGSAWQTHHIANCGAAFDGDKRFGGIDFAASSGTLYLANESAGVWTITKYVTADGGATWTTTQIASSRTVALVRPSVPLDRSSGPEVIWNRVSMYASFDNFVASLAGPAS